MLNNDSGKAFTLLEIMLVIAVMAVLASFVFVALNPRARLEDSRNSRRWSDVKAILEALKLDELDNGGAYHDNIADANAGAYYQIGTGSSSCDEECNNPALTLESACVDIIDMVGEGYLPAIPVDPGNNNRDQERTGYYLYKRASGQLEIGSCYEEQGTKEEIPEIKVSR